MTDNQYRAATFWLCIVLVVLVAFNALLMVALSKGVVELRDRVQAVECSVVENHQEARQ